jgi:hypothetical protein
VDQGWDLLELLGTDLVAHRHPPSGPREHPPPCSPCPSHPDAKPAVTGYDGSAKGHHREIPSGPELIDTRTWTVRQVDRHASSAVLAAGRLLAFGTAFGTGPDGANQGYGLTLYGPGDRQPVHRFGAKQVGWIQVNGELAYVQLMDANLSDMEGYAVVDLPSGRLLHQGTGTVPELLVPNRM